MQQNVYSGIEFNNSAKNKHFVKLTNKKEQHNGFTFVDGLNIDFNEFNPTNEWGPGGIYFITVDFIPKFIKYKGASVNQIMYYYRMVIIPNDAIVYVFDDKFKTDKIILEERVCLWANNIICNNIIEINPSLLKYVIDPTQNMCNRVTNMDITTIIYVPKNYQTEKMCLKAIEYDPNLLKGIVNQTQNICNRAISIDITTVIYVRKKYQTEKICLKAVIYDPWLLEIIVNQTQNICNLATKNNINVIRYVQKKYQTNEMKLQAVTYDPWLLRYINKPSDKIYEQAIATDKYIKIWIDDYKFIDRI